MENTITRKDVFKSYMIWQFFSHACYNYERMMGLACCWTLSPIIRKLYKDDPEKKKAALHRELAFFNTEVIWGACIVGLAGAMEEQYAKDENFDPDSITSIKSSLMGPLAGIGDTITQSIVFPIVISIAIGITLEGNPILGPLLVLFGHSAYDIVFRYLSFHLGHDRGSEAIFKAIEGGTMNSLVDSAGIVGCTVMGSLIASYVSMTTALELKTGYASFSFQEGLLDVVLPNALPLALTMICWKLLSKGWSTSKLLLVLTVVGVVGALVGIF